MRKTISSFLITAVFGLAGTLVMAQDQVPSNPSQANGPVEARQGHRQLDPSVQARHMAKRLKLSADQQSQVAGILAAQRDQVTSLRSDASLSREDRYARMQSIRGESESKIRALLTDDQKQSFDQMEQQRRDRQQNHKS